MIVWCKLDFTAVVKVVKMSKKSCMILELLLAERRTLTSLSSTIPSMSEDRKNLTQLLYRQTSS